MKKRISLISIMTSLFFLYSSSLFAVTHKTYQGSKTAPQPSSCIVSSFSQVGNQGWSNVSLKLTNTCGQDVDFQNATITFNSSVSINTNFWGNFGPISFPDKLQMTSQLVSPNKFIVTIPIHIPEEPWTNSILPNGQSMTVQYGITRDVNKPTYDPTSVKVYVAGVQPVQTGEIDLTNITAQPSGVSQNVVVIDVVNNGQVITKAQLPWSGMLQIPGLAPGNYTLQPENLMDAQGNAYQGNAVPAAVVVNANQKVSSTISYALIPSLGKMNIHVAPMPNALSGYTNNPSVTLTRADTGSAVIQTIPWNTTTIINQLANNVTYSFGTATINYKGNRCAGSFVPATLMSRTQSPQTTQLSYSCIPVAVDQVAINVSGLPSTTTSVDLTFTPNDGSAVINKTVAISHGQGSDTVNLNDGVIYNASASPISGYNVLFNPQPLTAANAAIENVTYQQQSGGKIIGYLPGWKIPPSATSLANAGYTHILVAFGVFSTTTPGKIMSAFDTVTKNYIDGLHNAGIKVSLSLGGASSSAPDTSVNFHEVLSLASSPTVFQQTFVQSVESVVSQYGFDGIDIDIEQGLNGGGTFAKPTGDIAVLANILKQLHHDLPNLLISLAPQVANISANRGFDATWGNYASLIMQTYDVLSWVGIQLYNTGSAFGVDNIVYDPNTVSSPNFSVAMATDLLANWPAVDSSGRITGFQPYISYLQPNQVVIGYPAPNAQGKSDGGPVTPTATIKRAIQCLRTHTAGSNSCDTYVPPQAYPSIGGVFNWEVTFDQANNFKFATDLKACVIGSNCN